MPNFIADLSQQHGPEREGYDRYTVAIASPELPCGAAWLASCLVEIGVPLWKPWGIDDQASWERVEGRRWRYQHEGSGWSRLVPGLVDGRTFKLLANPVPQFTHAWPGQLPLPPRLILFVRDPRDALYSNWQRVRRLNTEAESSLSDYLATPTPGIQLPPQVWLGYFLAAWKAASELRPTLIVRFEDAKTQPIATLRKVIRFLDLRIGARALARAIHASSHAQVVERERCLLLKGTVPSQILGPGIPFAHRSRGVEEQVSLDARLSRMANWYGYADAIAGSTNDQSDEDFRHILQALKPSSACPDLLESCLRAASAPR